MAVISKESRDKMRKELQERYAVLINALEGRELISVSDGAKKGFWKYPEKLCAIDNLQLSFAVDDFKTVLNLIGKMK